MTSLTKAAQTSRNLQVELGKGRQVQQHQVEHEQLQTADRAPTAEADSALEFKQQQVEQQQVQLAVVELQLDHAQLLMYLKQDVRKSRANDFFLDSTAELISAQLADVPDRSQNQVNE